MYKKKEMTITAKNIEQESLGLELFKKNYNPLIDRGYELLDEENYSQAFEVFSLAAAEDNTNTEILNGLGITLCETGRLREALQVLKRACRINENEAVTYANIAGVYWELDEYEQALYHYQRALDLDPEMQEVHYNMINLYMEMNCLYIALVRCMDFCSKFPDDAEGNELLEEIMINLALSLY